MCVCHFERRHDKHLVHWNVWITYRSRHVKHSIHFPGMIKTWWLHQMETFSALLALCAGHPPVTGQWLGALMSSLIYAWTNGWANNRYAGAHYDVTVMVWEFHTPIACFVHMWDPNMSNVPTDNLTPINVTSMHNVNCTLLIKCWWF